MTITRDGCHSESRPAGTRNLLFRFLTDGAWHGPVRCSEAMKKLWEEQRHLTQRRKVAKGAMQTKEFLFAALRALAPLREDMAFIHSAAKPQPRSPIPDSKFRSRIPSDHRCFGGDPWLGGRSLAVHAPPLEALERSAGRPGCSSSCGPESLA